MRVVWAYNDVDIVAATVDLSIPPAPIIADFPFAQPPMVPLAYVPAHGLPQGLPPLMALIDFEDQPNSGSSNCAPFDRACTLIANPLALQGVSFQDPFTLRTAYCSSPTCHPDPNNPSGGNIVLFLNPGGTIEFSFGTTAALLVIEGIGANPFEVKVTTFAGNSSTFSGAGVEFDRVLSGFSSASGISTIEVLGVGRTGGPLALSAVVWKVAPGR